MKSRVMKRSIILSGHKTSVSLEEAFWVGLKGIAKSKGKSVAELITSVDLGRDYNNLSSALRLFVLDYYQTASARLDGTPFADYPTQDRYTRLIA